MNPLKEILKAYNDLS